MSFPLPVVDPALLPVLPVLPVRSVEAGVPKELSPGVGALGAAKVESDPPEMPVEMLFA